jgi:hypothetical protein
MPESRYPSRVFRGLPMATPGLPLLSTLRATECPNRSLETAGSTVFVNVRPHLQPVSSIPRPGSNITFFLEVARSAGNHHIAVAGYINRRSKPIKKVISIHLCSLWCPHISFQLEHAHLAIQHIVFDSCSGRCVRGTSHAAESIF